MLAGSTRPPGSLRVSSMKRVSSSSALEQAVSHLEQAALQGDPARIRADPICHSVVSASRNDG